jgi:hypothetical protein
MIAPLYNNALDGDVQMRQQWLSITARAVKSTPKFATDLGCGTGNQQSTSWNIWDFIISENVFLLGLSMYMLDSKFQSLEQVTGVDLSTYKLAVCEEKKKMMVIKSTSHFLLYPMLHLTDLTLSTFLLSSRRARAVSTLFVTRLPSLPLSRTAHRTLSLCAWWHMSRRNGCLRAFSPRPTEFFDREDISPCWT